jgi:hypothetical protein
MQTIGARLATAYPATNRLEGVTLKPLREQLVGALRPAILCLMGAVLLVLLIACANVANLILVQREVAIRQALGADRVRLFSQFLAQTLILCLLEDCWVRHWLGWRLAVAASCVVAYSGCRSCSGAVDWTECPGAAAYAECVCTDAVFFGLLSGYEDILQFG